MSSVQSVTYVPGLHPFSLDSLGWRSRRGVSALGGSRSASARQRLDSTMSGVPAKNSDRALIARSRGIQVAPNLGCRVAPTEGRLVMIILTPDPPNVVELNRLGDEIAELAVHLEAATARLLDLIREFDARGGWNNGFRSCAAWLSWRVGFAPGAAREHVRVARALGTLPLLSQALARGELSYAKVRELTRVATPETEEQLLAVGRAGTSEHVERIVRAWRRMNAKAEAQETARQHAGRALHVYQDEDGMVKIRGRLTAEVGAVLMKALDAAREALYQRRREDAPEGDAPTMAQQQADALAVLAETALHKGLDPGTPAERYQVVVHADATVLADASQSGQSELEDGMRVPAGTSQRLACDATRVVMRHEADVRVTEVGAVTSAAWGVSGGAVSENGRLHQGPP